MDHTTNLYQDTLASFATELQSLGKNHIVTKTRKIVHKKLLSLGVNILEDISTHKVYLTKNNKFYIFECIIEGRPLHKVRFCMNKEKEILYSVLVDWLEEPSNPKWSSIGDPGVSNNVKYKFFMPLNEISGQLEKMIDLYLKKND